MYVNVCKQARWARSAGNSDIEHLCIIIIKISFSVHAERSGQIPKKTFSVHAERSGQIVTLQKLHTYNIWLYL